MAREISGSVMLTTPNATKEQKLKDTQDSNHTLHQSLIRKRKGIRLPAKEA
jgi:hypothetical protein